jgi:hypothetical protein
VSFETPAETRRGRGGFALVLAVVLLALVVLVLVMLTSLIRVETSIAGNTRKFSQARQNALFGLERAIAQLQEHAGRDKSVTATAEILGSTGSLLENHSWTGVWSSEDGSLRTWLVSGSEEPQAFSSGRTSVDGRVVAPNDDHVVLVGENSTDAEVRLNNAVIVPKQTITVQERDVPGLDPNSNAEIPTGAYAFWVGDEGLKARVNLADPHAQATATPQEQRYRFLAPQRVGAERFPPMTFTDEDSDGKPVVRNSFPVNSPMLRRLLALEQLPYLASDQKAESALRDAAQLHFHDMTTVSRGLLTNVVDGGLKLDLTPYLESAPNTTWLDGRSLLDATDSGSYPKFLLLKSWWGLSRFQDPDQPSGELTTVTGFAPSRPPVPFSVNSARSELSSHGVHPVLARAGVVFGSSYYTPPGGAGPTVVHRIRPYIVPYVVLWNPYDVRLSAADYRIQLVGADDPSGDPLSGNLEFEYVVKQGSGEADQVLAQPYEWLTPIRLWIEQLEMDPGEVVMLSIKNTGNLPRWTPYDVDDGIELGTQWRGTDAVYFPVGNAFDFAASPSDAGNSVVITPSGGIARLELWMRPNEDDAWVEIQRVSDLPDAEFDPAVDAAAHPIHAPDELIGGGPRNDKGDLVVLETAIPSREWSLKTVDAIVDPVGILANFNPRAVQSRAPSPGMTSTNWMRVAPNLERVGTEKEGEVDLVYLPNTEDLLRHRAYIGASLTSSGTMQKVLFEVPRADAPVLSLGKFQHVMASPVNYLSTYAFGNSFAPHSPSSDALPVLNGRVWDQCFLSGLPSALTAQELNDPTIVLPSNRIRVMRLGGNPVNVSELSADWVQRTASALRVEGAFNVNSTSVEAWTAVLSSMRDVPVKNWLSTIDDTDLLAVDPANKRNTFARFTFPSVRTFDRDAGEDETSLTAWLGHRRLTDNEVVDLAEAIVLEITTRARPFVSMAEFVNRGPGESAGLLQRAIDAAGINAMFAPTAAGAPGYLTQADILSALAPILTVRSDTFLIRAYGESLNPVRSDADGNPLVEGRAWCEAVVQRVPDYVEPSSTQRPWDVPAAGSLNEQLGRRFEIVSFRWLTPKDL